MTFALFDGRTECSIVGTLLDWCPCLKKGFQVNPEASRKAPFKESGNARGDPSYVTKARFQENSLKLSV